MTGASEDACLYHACDYCRIPARQFPPIADLASIVDALYQVGQAVVLVAGLVGILYGLFLRPLLTRPRIVVTAKRWKSSVPVHWTFAAVDIHNQPLPRSISWLVERQTAFDVEVHVEFRRLGEAELALEPIAARWSHKAEPMRATGFRQIGGAAQVLGFPAAELVPDTLVADLAPAPSQRGHEVAIAVLRTDGTAHGWGARSYFHDDWRNPAWELQRGEYAITIVVTWRDQRIEKVFRLPFLSADFAEFDLREIS